METKRTDGPCKIGEKSAQPIVGAELDRRKARIQREWDAGQRRWRALLGQIRQRQFLTLMLDQIELAIVQPSRRRL